MIQSRRFLCLFVLLVFLNGCASLSVEKMVPEPGKMKLITKNNTIKIGSITANDEDGMKRMEKFLLFGGNIKLESEILKKALAASIKNSQLFKRVVLSGTADYEINANIDLQGQRALYSGKVESLIKINYELVKYISNEIVWKKDFKTTGNCTIEEVYPAVERTNTAVERAVNKNLLKCIYGISNHLNHI